MNRNRSLSLLARSFLLLALLLTSCVQNPTPSPVMPTPLPTETSAAATSVSPTNGPSTPTTPTDTSIPPTSTTGAPTNTPLPQPTDTPGITPQPDQPVVDNQNFGLVCVRNPEIDPNQPLETTPFYVKGQVILTGPVDSINPIVDTLAQNKIRLTPVYRCTLGIPKQIPNVKQGQAAFKKDSSREGRKATFPFTSGPGGGPSVAGDRGLAMNLYQFDDRQVTLLTIFDQLAAQQRDRPAPERVYPDANYLTGHLSKTACGNPFGVEGSPFGVEGSPFGVEGSPYGGMGMNAEPTGFWTQWAFKQIALDPPGGRQFKETGQGVRVGVFDTSPYPQQAGGPPLVVTEPAVTPALNMTVHAPFILPNLQPATQAASTVDVLDHGLFVSSLVHAVAVESQIDLYQVLNKSGCGDLFQLDAAILDFLSSNWSQEGLKQPAVINLSLGIRKPAELPPGQEAHAEAEKDISQAIQEVQDAYTLGKLDASIESMETVLGLSDLAGMVIVAAAGNDSVLNDPPDRTPKLLNMPLPMDLPADYPFVVGVSASNQKDGPSCYSNLGDISAPGGDAEEGVEKNKPICKSKAATCPTWDTNTGPVGFCPWGVMGLSKNSPNGYAYWVGTSFATPLASGLAALLYQKTGNPAVVTARMVSRVGPITDARYGRGLIQVVKALQ